MSVTSIRLQKDLETPLDDLAKKLSRSKNWLINQAIKEFVEKGSLEEQRWAETLQALESVEQGKIVEAEDVHQWLETWGTEEELSPPKL
jgi:predicted transcriptional regulator